MPNSITMRVTNGRGAIFHFCRNCERESHLKTLSNERVFAGNSRLHITILEAGEQVAVPENSEPSFLPFTDDSVAERVA